MRNPSTVHCIECEYVKCEEVVSKVIKDENPAFFDIGKAHLTIEELKYELRELQLNRTSAQPQSVYGIY
jgi:hypothetical protein